MISFQNFSFRYEESKDFIIDIKDKIRNSQYEAMKAVNQTLINLYWGIGQEIYNQQQEKGWGKSIVEVLSKEIQKDFPDVKGFSASNLWRMRNFYVTYSNAENLAPLVREISWSKNIAIMEKCKDQLEREFYIKMTKNTLPEKMKDLLPSPEEIENRLKNLE